MFGRAKYGGHSRMTSPCAVAAFYLGAVALVLISSTTITTAVAGDAAAQLQSRTHGADISGNGGCMHDVLTARVAQDTAISAAHAAGVYRTSATHHDSSSGFTAASLQNSTDRAPTLSSSSLDIVVMPDGRRVPLVRGADDGNGNASSASSVPGTAVMDVATSAVWTPIRMKVYTEDLFIKEQTCTKVGQVRPDFMSGHRVCVEGDILTEEKRNILINYMVPRAVDMHHQRLSVKALATLSVGKSMNTNGGTNPYCSSFTPPNAVLDKPLTNVDLVLFVAAGTMDAQYEAWAYSCGYLEDGRPSVAVVNISPRAIEQTDRAVRVLAHELLHALGFSAATFQGHGMTGAIRYLRGKPVVTSIISPNVVQRAGNHFGCDSMPGMELDDNAGIGSSSSHWLARNAHDELMSPVSGPSMKYTAITMAAMEDLGFYKPNYANAEYMEWGFQKGCDILLKQCVKQGRSVAHDLYCDTVGQSQCTLDRSAVGTCIIGEVPDPLPLYYQYFLDPAVGGGRGNDYCPVMISYSNGGCGDGDASALTGSVVGPDARCFNADASGALTMPICADVRCDAASGTYLVRFLGAVVWKECPPLTTLDASVTSSAQFATGSRVVCPPYETLCPAVYNYNGMLVTLNVDPPDESNSREGTANARPAVACVTTVLVSLLVAAALFLS